MKVLFDQGTPLPLRRHLRPHEVDSAFERGWSALKNGDLLDQAEASGYGCLITTDQKLRHEQNLSKRRIRVVVLMTTSWLRIKPRSDQVRTALENLPEGGYVELSF